MKWGLVFTLLIFLVPAMAAELQIIGDQTSNKVNIQSAAGSINTFLGLTDTPDSYAGAASKCVTVNVGQTGLQFTDCNSAPGIGDITAVRGDRYITNGTESGIAQLIFNETRLVSSGFNSTFNSTYAPFAYNQTNTIFFYNQTATVFFYNQTATVFFYNMTNTVFFYNQTATALFYNQSNTAFFYNMTTIVNGDIFITNGSASRVVNLVFNSSEFNRTLSLRGVAIGFNSTFNSTYAQFAYNMTVPIVNNLTLLTLNSTKNSFFFNTTHFGRINVTGSNNLTIGACDESWNGSCLNTYCQQVLIQSIGCV